jgi:hypothetical protein
MRRAAELAAARVGMRGAGNSACENDRGLEGVNAGRWIPGVRGNDRCMEGVNAGRWIPGVRGNDG